MQLFFENDKNLGLILINTKTNFKLSLANIKKKSSKIVGKYSSKKMFLKST